MNSQNCQKIVVIGTTKIFKMICKLIWEESGRFLCSFIQYNNEVKQAYCKIWDNQICNREINIEKALSNIEDSTLVINVGSYYIYPKAVIQNKCLEVINYHNSLLPDYRGRNANTWVIFNKESFTGITWHKVTSKIDNGEIIAQEMIEIFPYDKAYELSNRQMQVAYDTFEKFWEEWIENNEIPSKRLPEMKNAHMYYSYDIPNSGIIDLRRDTHECIYCMLRSMDYGKFSPFPSIKLIDKNGEERIVIRYRIIEEKNMEEENNYFLKLENSKYIKIVVK